MKLKLKVILNYKIQKGDFIMFANENEMQAIYDNFDKDIINLARDIAEYFTLPPYVFMFSSDSIQLELETEKAFLQVIINKKKQIEFTFLGKCNDKSSSARINSFIINNQVYNNEYICRRIKDITKI